MITLKEMDGYSVMKRSEDYIVMKNGVEVARISSLGEAFGNRLAFDWHRYDMWKFVSTDFVRA